MKKIITMFMAVALVLSVTIPVSAAEPISETEVVLKNRIERSPYSTLSICDQTVYGALSSLVSNLSSISTIKNISSSYTWNVAETCVFVYIKSPTTGMWIQGAQYGKASSNVTVVTPTLTYGTNGAIASSVTKTYSGTATPSNYNSTAQAFNGYLGSVYTDAKVSKVVIKGIEGKTVKTIKLLNPDIPAMID